MASQVPCLVFLLFITIITLAFGGYYTIMHPKQTYLASCYKKGGKCLEHENCPLDRQSRLLTTCIHKRKVCCMEKSQLDNVPEVEDIGEEFRELP